MEELNIEFKEYPNNVSIKCDCNKFIIVVDKTEKIDFNNIDHFKQEGHQAINTMAQQEETP